jgi:hypothetical protein
MARFSPSVADHCISQEQTADHHLQQPYIANNKVGERDYLAVVVVVEQRDPARRPPLSRQQRLASTNVNAEPKSPGFDRQRKKSEESSNMPPPCHNKGTPGRNSSLSFSRMTAAARKDRLWLD